MKYLMTLWQRIHFHVFAFNKFTQIKLFAAPIFFLLKNQYVRKSYQKRGVSDPWKTIRQVLVDPKNSIIIRISDTFMCILIILILLTLSNFLSACFNTILVLQLNLFFFVVLGLIPTIFFNYYVLWRNNQYLVYFKNYEAASKSIRRKGALTSLIVILSIVFLLILSFSVMTTSIQTDNS